LNTSLGQVVYSKAGRDVGRALIVLEIVDEQYVLVADGLLRKLSNPKRKKNKHLEFTDKIIGELNQKLSNKVKVTDSNIRNALKLFNTINSDR